MSVAPLPELSRRQVRLAVAVLSLALLAIMAWTLSGPGPLKPNGEPVAPDFAIFYAAGRLAWAEDALAAYDWRAVSAAFDAHFGTAVDGVSWNYPPPLLLPVMALATLPYFVAAAVWTLAGIAAFVATIRLIAPEAVFMLAALVFPGTLFNILVGQNGLLVAAALGAGLALLDRRPLAAGLLLGLLSLKPNLVVLVPLALIAGGRWQALAGAAASAAVLAVAGLAAFGIEAWIGFLENLRTVTAWGDQGLLRSWRMPTVFAQLGGQGLPGGVAPAAHWAMAALAATAVVWAWRRRAPTPVKSAVLVAAIPFAPPYLFEYDLAILILPVLWLWLDGLRRGQHPAEPWVLLSVWTAAVLPPMATEAMGFHPGPLLILALLGLGLHRTRLPE